MGQVVLADYFYIAQLGVGPMCRGCKAYYAKSIAHFKLDFVNGRIPLDFVPAEFVESAGQLFRFAVRDVRSNMLWRGVSPRRSTRCFAAVSSLDEKSTTFKA